MTANVELYLLAIGTSFCISFALTPLVRFLSLRYGWMDAPSSAIKTHKVTTPSMGGIAIFTAYAVTLLLLRYATQFPTGTLRSLRALLIGGTFIFIMGIIDDVKKPAGLHFKPKFAVQILAACVLIFFGIRIRFITPDYLAALFTLLWVVGITNALNIIDIMDGLSSSQAAIAALGFLCVALPSEELYVNFGAAALAGAAFGFIPWNLSKRYKIFMGDSGSMVLGFLLAGLSLGIKYSETNNFGVFAPLLILFVPVFDTLFVMALRLRAGQSPFLGSKDHFALRLEAMGYTRDKIVILAALVAIFLSFCAFWVTQLPTVWAFCVYLALLVKFLMLSKTLAKVKMK